MAMSSEELIEELHERRRAIGLGESDGVEVELSSSSRAVLSFNLIKIDSGFQRRGLGERTVALLTEMSDGTGILLELIPRKPPGCDGMSDHQLAAWYRRHEFVDAPTEETPGRMARTPRR